MIIPLKTVHSFWKVNEEYLKSKAAQRLREWDFLGIRLEEDFKCIELPDGLWGPPVPPWIL